MKIDLTKEPLGIGSDGNPVYLKDIWPSNQEVAATIEKALTPEMFRRRYGNVSEGPAEWRTIDTAGGMTYQWDIGSTYVKSPPFFEDMTLDPEPVTDIRGARTLAVLADSVTTDHISPAGSIKKDSPAGAYLTEHQVPPRELGRAHV